jgi:lipopolysaccharide export LptBFGC system permease protein LptF
VKFVDIHLFFLFTIHTNQNIVRHEKEKKIEEVIERGDYELALKMNDKLSEEIQEEEIKEALERKRYSDYLKKEQEKIRKKKRPRLRWGYLQSYKQTNKQTNKQKQTHNTTQHTKLTFSLLSFFLIVRQILIFMCLIIHICHFLI